MSPQENSASNESETADVLQRAQTVTFGERAKEYAFAAMAVAHFRNNKHHRHYSNGVIDPQLLALLYDGSVLVCRLDKDFTPLIFKNSVAQRNSADNDVTDLRNMLKALISWWDMTAGLGHFDGARLFYLARILLGNEEK